MTQDAQLKKTDEPEFSRDDGGIFPSNENETEELRQALEAERDQRLRLAAEYENYRRRTKKEAESAAEKGKRELLLQLVSLADDLDLALADLAESSEAIVDGLRMIQGRFRDTLAANAVIAFESEGERFDPEVHEAFGVVPVDGGGPGTVHKEMRRGYFWNDKLFRPALVLVEQ